MSCKYVLLLLFTSAVALEEMTIYAKSEHKIAHKQI